MIDRFETLAICGSMKPAIGLNTPSAARELLRLAIEDINRIRPMIETLDLREQQLPFFDGRQPISHTHTGVTNAREKVELAKNYVFSVPAYWGGIGAAFKNFIEVVCGPNYGGRSASPFHGKHCALLIVGSEPNSAKSAVVHINHIFEALGLRILGTPVVIGDPKDRIDVADKLLALRSEIARLLIYAEQHVGSVEQ